MTPADTALLALEAELAIVRENLRLITEDATARHLWEIKTIKESRDRMAQELAAAKAANEKYAEDWRHAQRELTYLTKLRDERDALKAEVERNIHEHNEAMNNTINMYQAKLAQAEAELSELRKSRQYGRG